MPKLDVSTIYGHGSQKPIVELRLPKPSKTQPAHEQKRNLVQMSVDEARDLAMNLLQAAESAIQDAFIVDFMTRKIGLDDRAVAAFLGDFRTMRRDRQNDETA